MSDMLKRDYEMGIIRSTKAHYRKALVKYCLIKIEEKGEWNASQRRFFKN